MKLAFGHGTFAEETGCDLLPAGKLIGEGQPHSQRKVRAQKIEKSPKAARVSLVSRPMRSIVIPTGMVGES